MYIYIGSVRVAKLATHTVELCVRASVCGRASEREREQDLEREIQRYRDRDRDRQRQRKIA
jgi:hypothetical protein